MFLIRGAFDARCLPVPCSTTLALKMTLVLQTIHRRISDQLISALKDAQPSTNYHIDTRIQALKI